MSTLEEIRQQNKRKNMFLTVWKKNPFSFFKKPLKRAENFMKPALSQP